MATDTILSSSGVYTTVLGALNQFQSFTDLIYTAMIDTTLNSKYNILNTYNGGAPPTTPALKYFGIGTSGFKNLDTNQSSVPYPGDARMMDLYRPMPIRCIPLDDSGVEESGYMTDTERAKYRMRVIEVHNGIKYACYYLKLIEFDGSVEITSKDLNGNESEFVMDSTWLNPTPPNLDQVGGNINSEVDRLIVRATGYCYISNAEIMEAVTAIYNSDSNYARISEIGYYTGCDVAVDSSRNPVDDAEITGYEDNEAAYAQLAKGYCFRGAELYTTGSTMTKKVVLESECPINGIV